MNVVHCSALQRFSVLSLTCTNCDLRELKGLWTSVTSCDLNALCRRSEMLSMYGTVAYIYSLLVAGFFGLSDMPDSVLIKCCGQSMSPIESI